MRPSAGAAAPAAPAAEEDAPARALRARSRAKSAAPRGGRRYLIEVERSSNEMRVAAEVDGVLVHFILDTGATSCTLPGWAAREMNLQIDERTPRVNVVGIDGTPRAVPQVQIQSVAIGDLVVDDVEMNVIETMQEGLLGMPFFNRFKVSTDPTAGTLILEEIGSDARDDAVQGKNEETWRKQFAPLRSSLQEVRSQLASVPHEYIDVRARLEKREAELQRQLDELDERATRAGVPQSWRE